MFVRFIDNLEIIGSKRVSQFLFDRRLDLAFLTVCERLHGSRKFVTQERVHSYAILSSLLLSHYSILFRVALL